VEFLPSDLPIVTDLADFTHPTYVRASGAALPFSSEAFELVVTCDTLEHVPLLNRTAFVSELLRVASHCAVLIAPFDSEHTLRAESALRDYLASYGCIHAPLEEHFELGLPSASDLRAMLRERGLAAVEFADGYLPNWLAMMTMQLTPETSSTFQELLNRFYNRHISPDDRREPAYRRVFVIAKAGHQGLLLTVHSGDDPYPAAHFPHLDFTADLARVLEQAQRDVDARFASLQAENTRLRRTVREYEQGRFIRFMRCLHDWRNRLKRRSDVH
jgi:hypothetical protein